MKVTRRLGSPDAPSADAAAGAASSTGARGPDESCVGGGGAAAGATFLGAKSAAVEGTGVVTFGLDT